MFYKSNLKILLCGNYLFENNKIIIDSDSIPFDFLLLRVRKNPTPKKPKYFLQGFKLDSTDAVYISSLYPIKGKNNAYSMDFMGVGYIITLLSLSAKIEQI